MKVAVSLLCSLIIAVAAKGPLQVPLTRGLPFFTHTLKNGQQRAPTKEGLPEQLTILSYDIELTPIIEETNDPEYLINVVYGKVTIKVQTDLENVNKIVLSAFTETVTIDQASITVTSADGPTYDANLPVVEGVEIYTIDLVSGGNPTPLTPGTVYDVTMEFTSKIHTEDDHQYGIYRRLFLNGAGTESFVVATAMEPTGAREAFPCFDEPRFKAPVTLTIGHPAEYTAYANNIGALVPTPIHDSPTRTSRLLPETWVQTRFEPSPKMSVYLTAFLIAKTADYDCVNPAVPDPDIAVQVCGPVHLVNPGLTGGRDGGAYAAEQSLEILKEFAVYTQIDYALGKMQSVVIPDFGGALENWGLNTYHPQLLLTYGAESSESDRFRTSDIISHELIHQWFGNLVTCSFWQHIWINEGFADYFSPIGVYATSSGANFHPLEMRQFQSVQNGLEYDALPGSQPVVNLQRDIGGTYDYYNAVFNPNSYNKAGTLLRMVEELVQTNVFEASFKRFLTEYSENVATQDDFYAIVTGYSSEVLEPYATLEEIMRTWTHQSGFPLLRVSKVTNGAVYVSQERFRPTVTYSHADDGQLNRNDLWTIPLRVGTPGTDAVHTEWLDKGIAMKKIEVDATTWILMNPAGSGFYRVLYDTQLFGALVQQLTTDHETFFPVARSQLFDDYFTFVSSGHSSIETALTLTTYLDHETSAVVWHSALYHLLGIYGKLIGNGAYPGFETYMNHKLSGALTEIGLEFDPTTDKGAVGILKSILLDWACALNSAECQDYADRAFDAWLGPDQDVKIPVDVRTTLLCSAVARSVARFDRLLVEYAVVETLEEDRVRMINALACTGDETKINALLGHVHSGDVIRVDHRSLLLSALAAANAVSRANTIAYFALNPENTAAIIAAVTPDGVDDMYETLSNFVFHVPAIDSLAQVCIDFATELGPDVVTEMNQEVETMRSNLVWMEANEDRLTTWFNANQP